jgi:hypothetical protein
MNLSSPPSAVIGVGIPLGSHTRLKIFCLKIFFQVGSRPALEPEVAPFPSRFCDCKLTGKGSLSGQ